MNSIGDGDHDENYDYDDDYTEDQFPLDYSSNLSLLSSCRNPDLKTGGDWCLTLQSDDWDEVLSEYESMLVPGEPESCCLPPCTGIRIEKYPTKTALFVGVRIT